MSSKPLIFKADLVNSILAGAKTATRRIAKHIHYERHFSGGWVISNAKRTKSTSINTPILHDSLCPWGEIGNRIWVRETCRAETLPDGRKGVRYLSNNEWREIDGTLEAFANWIRLDTYRGEQGAVVPSIHMPRWASRLELEILSAHVERLQAITDKGAQAEGCYGQGWSPSYADPDNAGLAESIPPREEFAELFTSIYGREVWDEDPFVWVIRFKKLNTGAVS